MLILTSSNNYVTQDFISHLPKKPSELRLTFIPTAAEVVEGDMEWLEEDRQALVDAGFPVTDFTVTGKSKDQVREMLDTTDFVFVSGGNTFFLLQEMRKSGFAELINSYVDGGLIYGGTSAGSQVAGSDIGLVVELDELSFTASDPGEYQGLGLIDTVILPHWGSEEFKDRYEKVIKSSYKTGQKIILLTNDQYLLVNEGKYTIESI